MPRGSRKRGKKKWRQKFSKRSPGKVNIFFTGHTKKYGSVRKRVIRRPRKADREAGDEFGGPDTEMDYEGPSVSNRLYK